jgi:predicted MPP superfamily phosphohydrolase
LGDPRVFFGIILLIWAGLHVYVLWRLYSVPLIAQHVPPSILIPLITLLAASYILSRLLEHYGVGVGAFSHALEYIGAHWIGILFLIFVTFFVLDVATGFGFLFPRQIPVLRTGALAAAAVLILISFVQGRRAPTVTEYEVAMPGLSPSADGTPIVVASDLHFGSLNGHAWAKARAAQFASLKPQMILLVGDIFEGEQTTHAGWLPVLRRIQAPLGVFAVTGNHEFYAGPEQIVELYRRAGYRVLRDESTASVPGLVFVGVDDIAFRRHGRTEHSAAVERALRERPAGATVFLSHTPILAEQAARLGARLMLSGHTHEGQIWPFKYLVRRVFPLIRGRYEVDDLTVIVGRGTGTWGPRMRLWKRSEVLKITLRAI